MNRPTLRAARIAAALLTIGPAAACRGQAQPSDPAAPSVGATAAASFLAQNAAKPGVITTPSGLQYRIVHSGPAAGPHPALGDDIKVNYEGALLDGTVFDSTYKRGEPAIMPLAQLVPAWMEALPLMRSGDEWILYVPPALGYGDAGAGGTIPGGAVLVFKLQLLGVLPQGSSARG